MKNVLVTGASGLLGRGVCRQLMHQNCSVTSVLHIDSLSCSNCHRCVTLDLSSSWESDRLPADVDAIIHLAQSSKFRDFPDSALDVFNVNVASTARLLDFARQVGAKQFIYASSGGVYGNGSQAFKENAAIQPAGKLGYYLSSKACGEKLVQSYASVFQVTVLRPFFIYGPGQNRSMLISRLMDSVSLGKSIRLQGSDGIRVNPVHVEDASAAVLAALNTQESATYNIAGPDVFSIRQIAEAMGDYLGKAPVFDQHNGEPSDLIADITMMKAMLHDPGRHLLNSFEDILMPPG
jgi:UDP-glucose 4-epimerase